MSEHGATNGLEACRKSVGMTTEVMLRADAEKRGWSIVRRSRELGAVGVPCFVAPGVPGRCEIWVGIGRDSDELQGGLEWQDGNTHVANIRGLAQGGVYDRHGEPIGNSVKTGENNCTISIKKDSGEYVNAWDALKTYISAVYSGFRAGETNDGRDLERPYTFQISEERSREEVEWLDLVRGERVAIIGLGGVGSWIADLVAKADVAEVHGWDADKIEAKNIIRMPGAVNPDWIGKPKAVWFEETYREFRKGVFGHQENVGEQNIEQALSGITYCFMAVDDDEARSIVCSAMEDVGIPFVDVGLSLSRTDNSQVYGSIRIVNALSHDAAWRKAIPQVGQSGQEIYGRLELPDMGALAAGLAVQSWRKMRGQMLPGCALECLLYRLETDQITPRERGGSQ